MKEVLSKKEIPEEVAEEFIDYIESKTMDDDDDLSLDFSCASQSFLIYLSTNNWVSTDTDSMDNKKKKSLLNHNWLIFKCPDFILILDSQVAHGRTDNRALPSAAADQTTIEEVR